MSTRLVQAGSSQTQWAGRGHISIFIHCLHLLDLDGLEDWPGVTETTFTAKTAQQNLQHRIKAVEWCLYRLFELHDPNETKDKLRPFFPPRAPLQSLNLRAALYRCLTELKRNGVLGKEILLRKTMLDECKGDKFEETISAFAMLVLRKSLKHTDGPMHHVLFGNTSPNHVLPLILAYRKSLQHNLNKRNALRQECVEQNQRLDLVQHELKGRTIAANSTEEVIKPVTSQELEVLVNMNWIGDQRWIEILSHGPSIKSAFTTSRVDGITQSSEPEPPGSTAADPLLHELELKIKKHQSRLTEWKIIAKDLEAQRAKTVKAADPPKKPRIVESQFTEHKKLYVSNDRTITDTPYTITTQFQTLLDTMRQELSSKQNIADTPVVRRDSLLDISTAVQDEILKNSYERAENSPLETFNRDYREQEAADKKVYQVLQPDIDDSLKQVDVQHSPFPSSPISSLFDGPSSTWIPEHKSSATTMKIGSPDRDSRPDSPMLRPNSNKAVQSPSSPTKDWLSLLDRTRASMANFNTYKHPLDSDPIEQSTDTINSIEDEMENEILPFSSTPPMSTIENNKATLLERTRQSMSLSSHPNTNSKIRPRISSKPKNSTNRSSHLFPTNQFDSSQAKISTPIPDLTFREKQPQLDPNNLSSPFSPGSFSRSSTPRDKLFEQEADYASVFKSRPKIAVSPLLSPRRNRFEFADADIDSHGDAEIGIQREMERLKLGSGFGDEDQL